jgi:hypothetical protein
MEQYLDTSISNCDQRNKIKLEINTQWLDTLGALPAILASLTVETIEHT